MKNFKVYELPCLDTHKSFNGKAIVIEENGIKKLKSYDTIVCKINTKGKFIRTWGGYSVTTMRHINSFTEFFNKDKINKKAWEDLKVKKAY